LRLGVRFGRGFMVSLTVTELESDVLAIDITKLLKSFA
jgi:hypothetical protein